jgi:hypothetical protein
MTKPIIAACLLVVMGACAAVALENKGAETFTLDGGSRGVVPFPHYRHQNALADCNACHTLFPQEQGAIMRLKQEGKLAAKQVMNKHCIKCHRSEKRAGKSAGPLSCAKCHQKG